MTPVRRDGHGFRFGLHFWRLPGDSWQQRVRHYEQLGFSSITFTDHQIVPQWDPLVALTAVATASETIGLGSLVLDMALRNPVLTARSVATLEELSGDRLELGLGAGYLARSFAAVGVPFLPAAERIARLEESIDLMRQLWTRPVTTFRGRYFDVTDVPRVAEGIVRPSVLIGGGGPRVMRLAGRLADTASMIPRQETGDWSVADSVVDSTAERMAEKGEWVRRAAEEFGRDPDRIELHTMVARTMVGDDVRTAVQDEAATTGVTAEAMADSTLYLVGSGEEIRSRVQEWRERTGISYLSLFDPGEDQIEYLATELLAPLRGR